MIINFYKYQGTGNDFVLVDNRRQEILANQKLDIVKKMCERRFGVGSDGLIFIEYSNDSDFYMDFYNPDGSQSFCGNGSRCAIAFAKYLGIIKNNLTFEAIDGFHKAKVNDEFISVKMNDASEIQYFDNDFYIHTGSPHYVSFDFQEDIIIFGKKIRFDKKFSHQNGTNVNLIKEKNKDSIEIKTYERGVENETFSCGTGATACALIFAHKNKIDKGEIKIQVKGGDLKVSFVKENDIFKNIWLTGPAKFVFKGEFEIC